MPSAPELAAKAEGDSKNTSAREWDGPLAAPFSPIFSVSPDTIEWPKR